MTLRVDRRRRRALRILRDAKEDLHDTVFWNLKTAERWTDGRKFARRRTRCCRARCICANVDGEAVSIRIGASDFPLSREREKENAEREIVSFELNSVIG